MRTTARKKQDSWKKNESEKDSKGDVIDVMYQQYECQACFVLSFDYLVEVYKDKERTSPRS